MTLQTFEVSLHHAVRERQTATVGGGHFTHQELKEVLSEIESLRNAKTQQPQVGVLAQMLQPGGIVPIDVETTAMLVVEITRQHAAIERKDALLRRLISALDSDRHDVDDWPPESCEVVYAIKQELSQ